MTYDDIQEKYVISYQNLISYIVFLQLIQRHHLFLMFSLVVTKLIYQSFSFGDYDPVSELFSRSIQCIQKLEYRFREVLKVKRDR